MFFCYSAVTVSQHGRGSSSRGCVGRSSYMGRCGGRLNAAAAVVTAAEAMAAITLVQAAAAAAAAAREGVSATEQG
jgi:hypothetical protein